MPALHVLGDIVPFAILGLAAVTSVCYRQTRPNPAPNSPPATTPCEAPAGGGTTTPKAGT